MPCISIKVTSGALGTDGGPSCCSHHQTIILLCPGLTITININIINHHAAVQAAAGAKSPHIFHQCSCLQSSSAVCQCANHGSVWELELVISDHDNTFSPQCQHLCLHSVITYYIQRRFCFLAVLRHAFLPMFCCVCPLFSPILAHTNACDA